MAVITAVTLLIGWWFAPVVPTEPGSVVSIHDGDTLTVLAEHGEKVRVRLYGVDCPELAQAFGPEAKNFTVAIVQGHQVRLEPHDRDDYGRIVAVVYVGETNLNKELLRNGYAWWYRHYAPTEAEFALLERQAQWSKRGIWSEKKPEPPWSWRRENPR